jgi:gliding motility-associated-like protein
VTVTPSTGTTSFTSGADTVCQDAVDETYTATALNSTSIDYSLSPASAGVIDAVSGVMNWDAAFIGTATITATAGGLCGTSSISQVVIVNPAPGITSITGKTNLCGGDSGIMYIAKGNPGSTFVWDAQGGSVIANYVDSILVDWGNLPGEYDLSVQEFSDFGCAGTPVNVKVIVTSPDLELGTNQEICSGEEVEIRTAGTFNSYLWHDGSVLPYYVSNKQEAISLTVTDQNGCLKTDNMFMTMHPLPFVDLGKDTSLCGIESMILDGGSDGASFEWSTGETSREITVFEGSQNISVNVINEFDCEAQDQIVINPCSTADYFRNMPTAFTPNGDGKNDVWNIPELQSFPQAVIEIYDRWGLLVFRSESGYSKSWDGTKNGKEMPMDSYYYVINLNEEGKEPITGTVTLIK